jgi:pilus assembly protein CpaF
VVSAAVIVEGEVRELVRRRGIDPIAQPEITRVLVDDVISEYLDRSVTSSLPPLGDSVAVSRSVLDAVAGFGPLQPLLDDPSIEEIWINARL